MNYLGDSCVTLPCKNGGGCTTLLADTGTTWSAYRCVCPLGVYGQNCDSSKYKILIENFFNYFDKILFILAISSCSNVRCPTYKICSEQPTGPVCTCPGNKVGTFCQYGE